MNDNERISKIERQSPLSELNQKTAPNKIQIKNISSLDENKNISLIEDVNKNKKKGLKKYDILKDITDPDEIYAKLSI